MELTNEERGALEVTIVGQLELLDETVQEMLKEEDFFQSEGDRNEISKMAETLRSAALKLGLELDV